MTDLDGCAGAPLPRDEAARLDTLRACCVLDTPPEECFERITRLAATLFEVPIALVSLVDEHRQWFKSAYGTDVRETPRSWAFCAHAVLDSAPLVVADATRDPRFAANPLVTGAPGIRFYAGAPLTVADGQRIGTLCVIDTRPRTITASERARLADLAALVVDELELRLARRTAEDRAAALEAATQAARDNERLGRIVERAQQEIYICDTGSFRFLDVNQGARRNLGYTLDELRRMTPADLVPHMKRIELETMLAPLLTGEQDFVVFETEQRRKDGSTYPVSAQVELACDGDGPVFIAFLTDVTSIREMAHILRERERELDNLLRCIPDFVSRARPDTTLIYVNEPYARFLGRQPDDLVGKCFIDHVPPCERGAVEAYLAGLSPERPQALFEQRMVAQDGSESWFLWSNRMVYDGGVAREIVSVGRDITAQRRAIDTIAAQAAELERANAALRQSEQRFELAVKGASVGIWDWVDVNADAEIWSEKFHHLLGYEPGELEPSLSLFLELLHPDDRQRTIALGDAHLQTGQPFETEYRLRHKSGQYRWFLGTGQASRDATGRPVRMVGTIMDIHDRVVAQAELRQSEQALARRSRELELIFDNMPVHIYHKDDRNRVLRMNRTAALAMGVAESTPVPLDAYEHFPDTAAQYHRDDLEVLASGRPKLGIVQEYKPRGGTDRWISTDKVPYEDPATGEPRVLVTATDITELKRAQVRLTAQAEELKRSNRELDQFAALASHDLKAPLRAVANLATWLAQDLDASLTEESRRNLGLLLARVARMDSLLDGLLRYARVGRMHAESRSVDLNAAVREAFDMASSGRRFSLRHDPMPTIRTGPVPLQLVLRNLFSNAIKHHDRDEGSVTVTLRDQGDRLAFAVADDGPGIEPCFHARIFGMFQVLRPRDEVEGSGLGLAMIEKQLAQLGCTIAVESDPALGRGATFRFTWPKVWPEAEADPA
ncbi:MAG: PAS domain S-box protein, partial [Alphaproteobacteria bacterium]